MEFNQLRYFYEAARLEHITKAANALGVAQPAITLSVHKLEKELGVPLFTRNGRGVALTECGKYLYEKLGPIFDTLEAFPEDLRRIASFETDTVNINLMAASTLLTDIIIDYKRLHPEITFKITQVSQAGTSDITVKNEPGNVKGDGDAFTIHEKIYIAVRKDSPLAARKSIRLDDIKDEGFVSLSAQRNFRSMCDLFCKSVGFTPRIVFETDNPYTVKNLIESGIGVGFWPEFSWGSHDEEIKLIPISYPECSRTLIIEKTNSRITSAVEDFFVYVMKALGDMKENA